MTMSKITPSIRQVVGGKVAALQALGFNSVVTSEKLLRDERPSRLASILWVKGGEIFFQETVSLRLGLVELLEFQQFEHWIFIIALVFALQFS